jgi:predicted branched-subunit amino acid permease
MIDILFIVLVVLIIHEHPQSRLAEIVMLTLMLLLLFSIAGWVVLAAMVGILFAMLMDY